MGEFYHICFAVQSIEDACKEMTDVLGVEWNPVRTGRLGDWDFRIVFSTAGPTFFELIEGPPGSPWDITATGPRFDHIGYWAADLAHDKVAVAERGALLEFDSCPFGASFTLHRLPSTGARIELVDANNQAAFAQRWAPEVGSMPILKLSH